MQFKFQVAIGLFALATVYGANAAGAEQVSSSDKNHIIAPAFGASKGAALTSECADLAGVSKLFEQLTEQQKLCKGSDPDSVAGVAARQKLIYLRTKITNHVQSASLQVDTARGHLESSIAEIYELRAHISEKRNRITHRNTQINLVSGGFTKIAGYGIALGSISPFTTNVLEVFDGGVQVTLSALALIEQRREQKLEHGVPLILTEFFADKPDPEHYPHVVWQYLNNVPPGSIGTATRRTQLIENWRKSRLMEPSKTRESVTIDLLDERLAMLYDIKTVVTQLHTQLMQITGAVVASYDQDPEM